MSFFAELLQNLFNRPAYECDPKDLPMNQPPIEPPPTPPPFPVPPAVPEASAYRWDTRANIIHSCRVIMDEYHIGWNDKAKLCGVIEGESNFNIRAVHHNTNGSADYGLVQMNSRYWIGPGKLFRDVEEVFTVPEKSVRFLCESFLEGKLDRWYAYQNGSYKQFEHKYL